jgi:hypothetical protein
MRLCLPKIIFHFRGHSPSSPVNYARHIDLVAVRLLIP